MAKGYVLYNPLAGRGKSEEMANRLHTLLQDELEALDMTKIGDYAAFLGSMAPEDYLVIVGGDGTLNRFANDTAEIPFSNEILYFPTGTGNDFAKDLGMEGEEKPFAITKYLKNLPVVDVKGKRYRFINGVGFGIDGYCCQVGDEQKQIPGKKVNYTNIAIRGLLVDFAARKAKITVDGQEYTYKKVWIAPTMFGRYYGGGMNAAPAQDRASQDGTLSVMLIHSGGRLRTLCMFPSIFKGEHIKHKKLVTVYTGKEITVEFDRPTPLQIDGETVLDVTSYTATLVPAKEYATV